MCRGYAIVPLEYFLKKTNTSQVKMFETLSHLLSFAYMHIYIFNHSVILMIISLLLVLVSVIIRKFVPVT